MGLAPTARDCRQNVGGPFRLAQGRNEVRNGELVHSQRPLVRWRTENRPGRFTYPEHAADRLKKPAIPI